MARRIWLRQRRFSVKWAGGITDQSKVISAAARSPELHAPWIVAHWSVLVASHAAVAVSERIDFRLENDREPHREPLGKHTDASVDDRIAVSEHLVAVVPSARRIPLGLLGNIVARQQREVPARVFCHVWSQAEFIGRAFERDRQRHVLRGMRSDRISTVERQIGCHQRFVLARLAQAGEHQRVPSAGIGRIAATEDRGVAEHSRQVGDGVALGPVDPARAEIEAVLGMDPPARPRDCEPRPRSLKRRGRLAHGPQPNRQIPHR